MRIWSTEVIEHAGEEIEVCGALHALRALKQVAFLILRDARGLVQVVIEDPATRELAASLIPETALRVRGRAAAVPQAPGGIEIHAPRLEVLSAAVEQPPVELHKPALNVQLATLLEHAPVALRHPAQRALLRLGSLSMAGFRHTLGERGFTEIQSPKLVAAATEGGANVFAVDYFEQTAYLAQSPQFYKQLAVGIFERVFEVGPVFRAEPHATPRHLNQYTSLDVELGFIEDHTTVMALVAETLRGMLAWIERHGAAELRQLDLALPAVPASIPSLHFTEAQELILELTGEDCRHEPDLAPAHERALGAWARERHGSEFLFVVGYPMSKRPFYTHPDPARPAYSNSFDLLFRGLELVTGGQRLHRHADYLAALERQGAAPEPFASYLAAFKHGMPPHGGFAIGLERWVAQLTGRANVREVTLFPRDLHRL
ncbi:MAG TPA: aspartate--tRNA(Asn) ligase, partial [Herpetosiphonaceae bacterium]